MRRIFTENAKKPDMIGVLVFYGIGLLGTSMVSVAMDADSPETGINLGHMKTFLTAKGDVYHMEVDLTDWDRLVFADRNSLKITDGHDTSNIVGRAKEPGYVEGIGDNVRFKHLTGFTQINGTTVVIADSGNHCLRVLDRRHQFTSMFAGRCQISGVKEGADARFYYPWSVIKDVASSNKLLVSQYGGHAVSEVDIVTALTTTIVRSSRLNYPRGITFDFNHENLIIGSYHCLNKYNFKTKTLTKVTGTGTPGHKDGSLAEASFSFPMEIVSLAPNLTLVADKGNNRLRVVNEDEDSVFSICSGSATSINGLSQTCSIRSPYSFLEKDGLLYIGQLGAIRTMRRSIPDQYINCPGLKNDRNDGDDNPSGAKDSKGSALANASISAPSSVSTCTSSKTMMTHRDEKTARFSWNSPRGDGITATLPPGNYDFFYSLADGKECPFTVTVTSSVIADKVCSENSTSTFSNMANPITKMGKATFHCDKPGRYELELPVGKYDFSYIGDSQENCSKSVTILDSRIRKRLDFAARYRIKCKLIQSQAGHRALRSMVKLLTADVEDICSGECRRSKHYDTDISCKSDIVTISWPTDVVFSGDTEIIPSSIASKVTPQLKSKHPLKLYYYIAEPPIVYPEMNSDGTYATLLLNTICTDGYVFDSRSKSCVANGFSPLK